MFNPIDLIFYKNDYLNHHKSAIKNTENCFLILNFFYIQQLLINGHVLSNSVIEVLHFVLLQETIVHIVKKKL